MLLHCEAYAWYTIVPAAQRTTIELLKGHFKARFQPTDGLRMAELCDFNQRKPLPSESIEQFLDDMYCNRGKCLDKTK